MILGFGMILLGFLLGVVVVIAAEALGVLLVIKRLNDKIRVDEVKISSKSQVGSEELDPQQSLHFSSNKKGTIWVLESDKIPKNWQNKPSREQKRKKELLEVSPIKKYGKIKAQSLFITEPNGSRTTIQLKGCVVEAVSATNLSSKKWAKRFPIKVESKTSVIYNGSKAFYIYLDTSWEKEAWCKALRLASCDQKEKVEWFTKLHEDFQSYISSLNAKYNSFIKPSSGFGVEGIDRASKPDGAPSKVRQFLRKISEKTSKGSFDNISNWTSLSGRDERKNTEKLRVCQDAVLATGLMKNASKNKRFKSSVEDNAPPLSSTSSHSASHSRNSVNSDGDSDDKYTVDEGTLCLNLLFSRLFYDAKGNAQVKKSMQARIQRTLSNMRIPTYVGEVICTGIDIGKIPPCIVGMRVLPMEMSEVWAFEIDIEYSGGALLEIETRLEVRELDLLRGTKDLESIQSNNVGDVSSDLFEDFEYLGKQLNLTEQTSDVLEPKEDDVSKSLKSTTSSSASGSGWKSLLNSVAKQVSQVPLTLAIRVTSLRGTLRLHIKPPPSDQLWYGFTSTPDIDFNLESSVGEHKIASGHLASFLVNRLKAAIQESIVLPNCESICIPMMLAEKDDWVPRNVAPFIWVNQTQESGNKTPALIDAPNLPHGEVKLEAGETTSSDDPMHKQQKMKSSKSSQELARNPSDSTAVPSSSNSTLKSSRSSEELRTPLLQNDKPQETRDIEEQRAFPLQVDRSQETSGDISESQLVSVNRDLSEKQNNSSEQEEPMPKKMGRREKMLDFRKKMGEKFEEKRRHIEEKGRHIVEKMRGP
ncbi:hypothetical protein L6164_008211 [Bauhinia variegata]|uniref:Uncharacterized protein n=1 Tax=Bauhinia variegata TaxID=167791 RepID=A0ACB9PG35_BAUVA|nr:hypothetical protein L6164_008211 [Bauhinia variegata]